MVNATFVAALAGGAALSLAACAGTVAGTHPAAPDWRTAVDARPPLTAGGAASTLGDGAAMTAAREESAAAAPLGAPVAVAPLGDAAARNPEPAAASQRQVMVTLAPAPAAIWAQITVDLQRTYRLRSLFAWSMQSLGERCIVFEAPPDRSLEVLLRRLAADPRIEVAQPVQRFTTQEGHPTTAPSGVIPLQHSAQVLRLAQAHRWATGKGVRVAVIDTGIDVEHPELKGRVSRLADFVGAAAERGGHAASAGAASRPGAASGAMGGGGAAPGFNNDIHGTAVAGVIVAALNAEMGLVGVAPQAEVWALKACWQERPGAREAVCDSYTLAKAVDYAIGQGAQVINFSLAGPPDPLLAKLVAAALARGIVVVAAAGPDARRSFPASEAGVLAVAGSDDLRGGLRFPTRRLAADTLAAPGVDILTTVPNGHYDFFSGSSFAAAQVTGVVALLLEREPRLGPTQLAAVVHRTGHPIQVVMGDPSASVDQVDACAALAVGRAGSGGGCH